MKRTRGYRLGRRGEAAQETRQRIVEATFALHERQGVAATSMKQIAEEAGVSVGSVYHHFPTYEDAINACGQHTMTIAPVPTPDLLEGITALRARVEQLAVAVFEWFERVPGFGLVRSDQDKVPVLKPFMEAEENNRLGLMQLALQSAELNERQCRVAASLLDFEVYQGLRRAGLAPQEAAHQITTVIVGWVENGARE
ncbi:TetR/AcrR family transcriptional regulator [Devosia sp. RR2S18]|uniref:TetR/AcrR family transcriptional regulator n=1 Tax=Devosia rhizosphaerae TaxID=3049774 RepID=UPI00254247AF|nr:TetR/AcrR family transcriptional regulator [Devosia sp. RR2S18]WIJ23422.1 TetR/AcrR family transcriptional regulator [Devosia sp. RR2S18]